jgi:DNA helicase HerA-like ATPase
VREQDIIAVDGDLRDPENIDDVRRIRVWAKVQQIERLNPLFPSEAGHELAATRTDPLDTVLSLSREMVTAVCTILGSEPLDAESTGKLGQLRYPARPATRAYRPHSADIKRVVVGELRNNTRRALDIATLANRGDIDVSVDGHAIVSRHLAILAMTGAGKSWASRRIIEQLAERNFPIVIFDPHGDYTGLSTVPSIGHRVRQYYARLPLFDEDADTVASVVSNLGYKLTDTMVGRFGDVFRAAQGFLTDDLSDRKDRVDLLLGALGSDAPRGELQDDLWLVSYLAAAGEALLRSKDSARLGRLADLSWPGLRTYSYTDVGTLEGIKKRTRKAASALQRMERISRQIAHSASPLPRDRNELVNYGQISVVTLAGYTSEFQATIYSIVADDLLDLRVRKELPWPLLLVLEEAHTFAPGQAHTDAEIRAIATTKQIAQEGRKFGVGLVLISQRPSRLDETTLSQCNSFVVMRMVNPADQAFVRRVIESLGEDDARMLPDLDVGEALLAGQMINFPVLVRMKPPESRGEREEDDSFATLEQTRVELESRGHRQNQPRPR